MIGIVGGGLTGLLLSERLGELGVDHVVFEADPTPGGVIRTVVEGGRVLELGPQRTRLVPPVAALVEALGLGPELVLAEPGLPLYVYRDGRLRLAPFTPAGALRSDLLTLRGKARVLLEPFTGRGAPDESVADFLTRKFGREAYEHLLGPLYGGLYASDPADMVMRYSLSRALAGFGVQGSLLMAMARWAIRRRAPAPACSFRQGLGALIRALYERRREHVRLGEPVRRIAADGGSYVLETDRGKTRVAGVVITAPAGAAADMLRGLDGDVASRLSRLRYNPLAVVHLHSEAEGLRGLGYQVSLAERLVTRGVTWNASMFGRSGVYTAYLGGARRPEVVDMPDDRIAEIAAEEFEEVTGAAAEPIRVSRVWMPAWDRSWSALDGLRLPDRVHLCANYESRPGIPGRIAAAAALARRLATPAVRT